MRASLKSADALAPMQVPLTFTIDPGGTDNDNSLAVGLRCEVSF